MVDKSHTALQPTLKAAMFLHLDTLPMCRSFRGCNPEAAIHLRLSLLTSLQAFMLCKLCATCAVQTNVNDLMHCANGNIKYIIPEGSTNTYVCMEKREQ